MRDARSAPHWLKPSADEAAQDIRAKRKAAGALAMLLALVAAVAIALIWPSKPEALPVVTPSATGQRIVYPAGHYPTLVWLDGQRQAVRSLLDIGKPMSFGEFVWNDAGIPMGAVWVRVDLGLQTLSVFRAGHEIGTAVILYGADAKPTPPGLYPILERAQHHRSTLYDAEMPYMLRLTGDGVAIHASNVRASSATHGCIGVPLDFARRLFGQVKRGDPVVIVAPESVGQSAS